MGLPARVLLRNPWSSAGLVERRIWPRFLAKAFLGCERLSCERFLAEVFGVVPSGLSTSRSEASRPQSTAFKSAPVARPPRIPPPLSDRCAYPTRRASPPVRSHPDHALTRDAPMKTRERIWSPKGPRSQTQQDDLRLDANNFCPEAANNRSDRTQRAQNKINKINDLLRDVRLRQKGT